jgi:hydroxyisourate hydrolase
VPVNSRLAAVEHLNALPADDAARLLAACCAADGWSRRLVAGRPYRDAEALLAAADRAVAELDWPAVAEVLRTHPRIGQRPAGDGRAATWSRTEQSGVSTADGDVLAALADGNGRYERRFGYVFLIRASGLSAAQMLDALLRRLDNDPQTERGVVRRELAGIVRLRLSRLLDELVGDGPAAERRSEASEVSGGASVSTHVLDTARGRPAEGVPVRLERRTGDSWCLVGAGRTDGDGRLRDWAHVPTGGVHRLVFDTGAWFAASGLTGLYPEVVVTFTVSESGGHYHIPLLLSPFAYSTYRGS